MRTLPIVAMIHWMGCDAIFFPPNFCTELKENVFKPLIAFLDSGSVGGRQQSQ